MEKSTERIHSENCMKLSTEAVILDLRMLQIYMQGGGSDKLKRILKKSTQRIIRRNKNAETSLQSLQASA